MSEKKYKRCSFCGRAENQVALLMTGMTGYICNECVEQAHAIILEEIAKEYAGELYIYKINVDNDPYIADAFNIQAIPTLLFIPMEGRYKVQTGGVSKEELVNMIKLTQKG